MYSIPSRDYYSEALPASTKIERFPRHVEFSQVDSQQETQLKEEIIPR